MTYYNEFDPYPAEWLRNLIRDGHISNGTVDSRSILEVQPRDINARRAHFFAGIGVWDYALKLAGGSWGYRACGTTACLRQRRRLGSRGDVREVLHRSTQGDVRMSWVQTYTGKRFDLLNPTVDSVDIDDIARALSMQCRFNGHTLRFYSVAEHSVHVSRLVEAGFDETAKHRTAERTGAQFTYHPDDLKRLRAIAALCGLLHDAAEAYMGDIVRPLKRAFGKPVEDIESNIELVIHAAFMDPVPSWFDTLVKVCDDQMLSTEAEWLLDGGPLWRKEWQLQAPDPLMKPAMLTETPPKEAEHLFHARFDELSRRITEGR